MDITANERHRREKLDAERAANPPNAENVRAGLHDFVAVLLKPDDARALAGCIDNGDYPSMDAAQYDRVVAALADGILAYDGPDGDDGRAFEDAAGKPHYEP